MSRHLSVGVAVALAATPAVADELPPEDIVADDSAEPSEPSVAAADPLPATASEPAMPLGNLASAASAGDDLGDQGVGVMLGVATGGRVTAGGLRITGHYLYQMSASDWFDGAAAFTFGGGDRACFRDRMDLVVCDHGLADGAAIELQAGVRRMFARQGRYQPFARAALGLSYVRFSDDDVSGFAVPLHLGAGLRARVASGVAVVAHGDFTAGIGRFGRGLGAEPQLGLAVTAGAEFRLP